MATELAAESKATREDLRDVALRIKLVILDVDGVMTDGGIYVGVSAGGEPVEMKRSLWRSVADNQTLCVSSSCPSSR